MSSHTAPTPMMGPVRAGRFLRALAFLRERRAIVLLFLLFTAFLAMTFLIRQRETLEIDVAITRALQRRDSGPLTEVARALTVAGNFPSMAVVALPVALVFARGRRFWAIALLVAAASLGHPLNYVIKMLFNRPRPGADVVQVFLPATGTSFPSGHAMVGVMFYGLLAFLCWVYVRAWRVRAAGVAALSLFGMSIGVSRIYLGAHWFSDVVGGWAAGLFFLLLLAEAYKHLGGKELTPRAVAKALDTEAAPSDAAG
jgi:undecaprenyl-diphosphatase